MGYYDKGSYSSGGYDPLQERQSARDRYLELLTKQRLNDQAMVDKMRKEEASAKYQDDVNAQGEAAKGAQMGSAGGPWGMLAGAIVGRAVGGKKSYDARRKKGEGRAEAGFNAFLNPIESLKGVGATLSGGEGNSAMAGTANSGGRMYQQNKNEKLMLQLQDQQNRSKSSNDFGVSQNAATEDDYGSLEASSMEPQTFENTTDGPAGRTSYNMPEEEEYYRKKY